MGVCDGCVLRLVRLERALKKKKKKEKETKKKKLGCDGCVLCLVRLERALKKKKKKKKKKQRRRNWGVTGVCFAWYASNEPLSQVYEATRIRGFTSVTLQRRTCAVR